MPEVKEYVADANVTPDEKGTQAALIAGRRLGEFGRQIAGDIRQIGQDIGVHQTAMWANQFYTVASKHEIDQATATDAFINDPANKAAVMSGAAVPAIMQRYDEWAQPLLDAAPTPEAKAHAAEELARQRIEIFRYAAGAESKANGRYYEENDDQTTNNRAASALANPTSENIANQIQLQRQQHDPAHGGVPLPPNMSPEEVDKLKEKDDAGLARIVQNGYEGMIRAVHDAYATAAPGSVEETKAQQAETAVRARIKAQENFDLLPGADQGKLSGMVDEAVKTGREQYQQTSEFGDRERTFQYKAAATKLTTAIAQSIRDNGGVVTPELIAQANALSGDEYAAGHIPGEIDRIQTMISDAAKPTFRQEFTNDKPITGDLLRRSFLPEGDPNRATEADWIKAKTAGQVSTVTYEAGIKAVQTKGDASVAQANRQFDSWLTQWKPYIESGGTMAGTKRGGAAAYAAFVADMREQRTGWLGSGENQLSAVGIMTDPKNPKGVPQAFIDHYARAARTGNPEAALQSYPGYVDWERREAAALGSVANPVEGPTRASVAQVTRTPPPGPVSADRLRQLDDLAKGR